MRARSISTIAVAFVTLAVVFLVGTLTIEAAGQKKGGKGKPTPVLGRAVFRVLDPAVDLDPAVSGSPAHIQSDSYGEYVDSDAGLGGAGVEVRLGGTKGLGRFYIRLEESNPPRTVTLDFSKPVLDVNGLVGCLVDGENQLNPDNHFLAHEKVFASVRELSTIFIVFDENVDCGGLGCIPPGERRASGLYLTWVHQHQPDIPNTRVGVVFRSSDADFRSPDQVMITRCGIDSTTGNTPEECTGINDINDDLPGSIPENTWIISTRFGFDVINDIFTGPRACISGHSIKGKSIHTNYGLFDMPFDLVISCVNPDCS